jgi:hypothetical protein
MSEFGQPLEEKMYRHDGDLFAVRQVDAFQRGVPVCKGIDSLVCQISDSDESNAPQFGQASELEHSHICE